ncbi:MAG: TetR/AcrR family transcriptional regulator, partial [Acidiferrobacterales bacterium]
MTTHRQIQVTALDPTGYEAGSQRRQQLIDATIVAISEYGLSRTTLAKVAKLAQLSPGIVNFYFKRKDELLLATLRFLAKEFQAAAEAAVGNAKGDAARALDALIDVYFDPAIADVRKIAVWSAFWGESQARQEYVKLCGDADAAFHDTIFALCRQLVDNGEQRHIDMNAIAQGFEGILDGQWQEILC